MGHFETFALPKLEDGRDFLPDRLLAEEPKLRKIVELNPRYWKHDMLLRGYVSQSNGYGVQ